MPAGEGFEEARNDRQRREGLGVAPAGVVCIVARAQCPGGDPAPVVIDIEDRSARCLPLHTAQQPDDLDGEPGLLGHLADHRAVVGLPHLYPAAGHRPTSPPRFLRSTNEQQPLRVVEHHCPDTSDPLLG